MAARHRLLATFIALAAGLLLAGGCKTTSPPTTVSGPSPRASTEAPSVDRARSDAQQPAPEASDPHAQAIEALTRKTASHAQNMEELLARRGADPATQDSAVEWLETDAPSDAADSHDLPQANSSVSISLDDEAARQSPATPSPDQPHRPAPTSHLHDGPQILPPEADHDLPLPSDRAHSDLLYERLARHIREYPRDTAGHLEYQLLQFLRGEQVPQLAAIASLPAEDRELLVALLDGLSNFRSTLRADNNMLLSRKVRPLLNMSDRLRTQADLHIPTIALCTRVDGFGVYEPIQPARFIAGREQPVIIYCEVQNFSSQMNDDRRWETRLSQEAVLYADSGMSIWQEPPYTVTDLSRNRRHDFFVVKLVRLPANLSIGQYVLKVTIRDEHAGRVAEASVPIQIVLR